jgi:hypothetical protein
VQLQLLFGICDLVEFYLIALMLLAALIEGFICGGMRDAVFFSSFSEKYGLRQ